MKFDRTGLRPEVEQVLASSRAAKGAEPTRIEVLRTFDAAMAAFFNSGAPAIALERTISIDTPAGPLRAVVYAPVEQPKGLPVVLHLHGGGFVFMSPETYSKPCKEVAIGADAIVVSLEYRLAPEHPYPIPLDDCVAAFRWLRSNAAEIGGDPARVGVMGESAGGALAASLTLRLLAEGDAPPAAVALSSAWLDLRMGSESSRALGPDDPLIDDASLGYWRGSYAPREEQWSDPFVSPLLGDVSSFPPTCVVAAGIDPFYSEDVAFAEKLRAAGRDVELLEYEGMPHTFWTFPPLHGLTDATERVAAFMRRQLRS